MTEERAALTDVAHNVFSSVAGFLGTVSPMHRVYATLGKHTWTTDVSTNLASFSYQCSTLPADQSLAMFVEYEG